MNLEQIKATGKCCVTGKPLSSSKHVNAVQLNYRATWQFPVGGNIITGDKGMAMAFVHDDAIGADGKMISPVKYAVETTDTEIIYHELSTLEEL